MQLEPKELNAIIAAASGLASFLLAWGWGRFWKKRDSDGVKVSALEGRMQAMEIREDGRAKMLGALETNHSRLDGKIEGLQTFWRSEFGKLTERFEQLEDKIDSKLEAVRTELRRDQEAVEGRLTQLLLDHQNRIHNRLNVIAADQSKMLSEFVDQLVDKKAGD